MLRDVLSIIAVALLLAVPGLALGREASRLGPGLAQALHRPLPAGGCPMKKAHPSAYRTE